LRTFDSSQGCKSSSRGASAPSSTPRVFSLRCAASTLNARVHGIGRQRRLKSGGPSRT